MSSEADRLIELRTFRVGETLDNETLRKATGLAAYLFQCPISTVNLIDDETQWLLGRTGLEVCSVERDIAFCSMAITLPPRGVLVVEDAALDPRFRHNPLVTGEPGIRFYAGAVLTTSDGFNLGALCVIDTVPRPAPGEAELERLRDLADLVVTELERSRSERRRLQHKHMLDMAEAMSGVGHWRVRLPSNQVMWSDEVYTIYGLDRESYNPQYLDALDFYLPADAERLRSAIVDATLGRGPFELELAVARPDGESRYVAAKGACAFDAEGAPALLYGVFQDITAQRLALAAAETAALTKADLLANVSHELRTPLTSIVGFAELALARDDLAPQTRDYLRRIDNAGRSLSCLVNDILDFSKLEAGQVTIRPEVTDLEALGQDILELFGPQTGAKDLELELQISPKGAKPLIDPTRVQQILINLVGNAVKFTEQGRVRLGLEWDASSEKLVGTVSDTGPGLSPDQAAQLFLRFSQVDGSATRKAGGTGLGLAICKGLSEAMGGRIWVDSTPGVGSRFSFEIHAASGEGLAEASPTSRPVVANTVTLAGLSVLVVDDHPANRQLAEIFLNGFGAEVTQAMDGRQAVERARSRRFDAILMDMRMPGLDGDAALAALREEAGESLGAPILAFTADATEGDETRWTEKGFDGVVRKPVSAPDLLQALTRCLSTKPRLH